MGHEKPCHFIEVYAAAAFCGFSVTSFSFFFSVAFSWTDHDGDLLLYEDLFEIKPIPHSPAALPLVKKQGVMGHEQTLSFHRGVRGSCLLLFLRQLFLLLLLGCLFLNGS